jgi:hypothetical protein
LKYLVEEVSTSSTLATISKKFFASFRFKKHKCRNQTDAKAN